MNPNTLVIGVFEFVLLVFSLSVHECAHAWVASLLGDQTARLQGRITLNPAQHIDPVGTILFPLVSLFIFHSGILYGWAKPTPVITRNFKKIVRDDNLVTLAGPVSNLLLAFVAAVVLAVIIVAVPGGRELVFPSGPNVGIQAAAMGSPLGAIVVLALLAIELNLTLFFFNLLPIPPLDGSRIVRNLLPYNAMQVYDRIGGFASWALMIVLGWILLPIFMGPSLGLIFGLLSALPGR